ncbi:MAG: protein kinase domain-containing protein [Planctomycetota bacterium]|jgi:serine/threonine protein kinase
MVGQSLGHYRILRTLGVGGMGEVFAAEDTRLKRQVALKVLPPDVAADPARRERFQREAEAVASLDHPNIVAIHSIETATAGDGGAPPVHFFTMQLVDGRSLDELIPDRGFSIDRFLKLAIPVVEAVGVAHRNGITHRDLKPGNVMVGDDGRVRVLDFGLAKLHHTGDTGSDADDAPIADQTPLTRTGTVLGTAPYMSPEQVKGLAVDPRSDVFSLGCVLYEMAVGCLPFSGATSAELMSAILRDTPDAVCARNAGMPVRVGDIIERCLEKNPAKRYATAGELHSELAALHGGGDVAASTVLGERPRSAAPTVPSTSSKLPARPSLAVMPFVNLSGDPAEDGFALGLWADINAELVKISGLFLVSEGSTGLYHGKSVTPQQAGRELGVRHVLEGTVRRAGQRVRITARLTDIETGALIWSDRYDRTLDDLFELQDEIAEEIVKVLDIKLLHGESHRIMGRSLRSPKAREIFHQAVAGLFTYKRAELLEARRRLAEVAEIEPESPLPHVFTAFAHYFDARQGFGESQEKSLEEALDAVDRAQELGDPTGLAHLVRGMALLMCGDHDAALEASTRALPDRPSCPWGYALVGAVLNYTGRPAEAVEMARLAMRHTPLYPPQFASVMALGHYLQGEHDDAVEAARGTIELIPDNLEAHVILVAALAADGRIADARAAREEIFRVKAGFLVDDFARTQPFKDQSVLARMVADLREAGLS